MNNIYIWINTVYKQVLYSMYIMYICVCIWVCIWHGMYKDFKSLCIQMYIFFLFLCKTYFYIRHSSGVFKKPTNSICFITHYNKGCSIMSPLSTVESNAKTNHLRKELCSNYISLNITFMLIFMLFAAFL